MKMPRTKRRQFALGGLIGALLAIFLVLTLLFVATMYSPPVTQSPYLVSHLAFFVESDQEQGQVLYLADLETRQIAPVTSVSLVTRSFWSPDGKHITFVIEPVPYQRQGWVVNVEQGRTAQVNLSVWSSFQTWVLGRHAVFNNYDQYGNGDTLVFDALDWKVIIESTQRTYCDSIGNMSGECKQSSIAVSPTEPLVLLNDGRLIHLPDLAERSIMLPAFFVTSNYCGWMVPTFSPAAWSPDGAYLVFVGRGHENQDCASLSRALYLARGDGTQARRIITVPLWETFKLSWATSSESVTLEGKEQKYVLDVASQQVQVLPYEASTQESQPPQGVEPCGDVARFLVQDSELLPGETVTAACWSPDGALLAVGTPGALNIYDAQLSLSLFFRVDGAVKGISWSPVP